MAAITREGKEMASAVQPAAPESWRTKPVEVWKAARAERVQTALASLVRQFEEGTVSALVSELVLRRQAGDSGAPSSTWSISNQMLMLIHGTHDARGFKQWLAVGRRIRKGGKAFSILAPWFLRAVGIGPAGEAEQTDEGGEAARVLRGFNPVPVFRFEDTEGDPLETYDYSPPSAPPLLDVAASMGIVVEYAPGEGGQLHGFYRHGQEREQIVLMDHSDGTFWHELAHAAHARVIGWDKMHNRGKAAKEVVAEVSATAIARLYGRDYSGNAWSYLRGYIEGKGGLRLVIGLLNEIAKVLALIFEYADGPAFEQGADTTEQPIAAKAAPKAKTTKPKPRPALILDGPLKGLLGVGRPSARPRTAKPRTAKPRTAKPRPTTHEQTANEPITVSFGG